MIFHLTEDICSLPLLHEIIIKIRYTALSQASAKLLLCGRLTDSITVYYSRNVKYTVLYVILVFLQKYK